MPPTLRRPTVELPWLFQPPVRMRVRALHHGIRAPCSSRLDRGLCSSTSLRAPCSSALLRASCSSTSLHHASAAATYSGQRRSLQLWTTARAKTTLGQHKILDFEHYLPLPPSASKHKVTLVKSLADRTVVAKEVTLAELYTKHAGPGKILVLCDPIDKKMAEHLGHMRDADLPNTTHNTYCFVQMRPSPPKAGKERSKRGNCKVTHLLLSSPVAYTALAIQRAYNFIEDNKAVEFVIRMPKTEDRRTPADPDLLPWVHEHFPHLRPDFILKSMPQDTKYLVEPVSNGHVIHFVVGAEAGGPRKDLTKSVFAMKKKVQESLHRNIMAQNYLRKRTVQAERASEEPIASIKRQDKTDLRSVLEKAGEDWTKWSDWELNALLAHDERQSMTLGQWKRDQKERTKDARVRERRLMMRELRRRRGDGDHDRENNDGEDAAVAGEQVQKQEPKLKTKLWDQEKLSAMLQGESKFVLERAWKKGSKSSERRQTGRPREERGGK